MEAFSFTGLGTKWSVLVDAESFQKELKHSILCYVEDFENRFSRFLPQSEVNAFRESSAGEYSVSREFLQFLTVADKLRVLTSGVYDPAVATLLENAGYGAKENIRSLAERENTHLPVWSLSGDKLVIDGPIAFDLGGIGKGYCIDRVAEIVRSFGCEYFLVDGGGDMVATMKADGSPYRIAVEYPGKLDTAASLINLSNQGLAVSDSFRRRFGKWHHLIDVQKKKPVEQVIGCAALAENAWMADCMTSGLFFAPVTKYPLLTREFNAEYLVFQSDGTTFVSAGWSGELL